MTPAILACRKHTTQSQAYGYPASLSILQAKVLAMQAKVQLRRCQMLFACWQRVRPLQMRHFDTTPALPRWTEDKIPSYQGPEGGAMP